jgi:hypothetical protein
LTARADYDVGMSTLVEIEAAARQLSSEEKQRLLVLVAQSLRAEGRPLPEPRRFSDEELKAWMDEDEADLRSLRGGE